MKEIIDIFAYEKEAEKKGIVLCGIDEAGRGPLAGPVCAAAVILDPANRIEGLDDSKKLSEKKRDRLYDEIISNALSYGVAFSSHEEIDDINILQATFLAMNRAFEKLDIVPGLTIVDGNRDPHLPCDTMCLVKGDAKCASVAAASILAKVTRDRYMLEMAEKYPQYGFEQHKGYPTKAHYAALDKYGVCEIHRRSFLKKLLGDS